MGNSVPGPTRRGRSPVLAGIQLAVAVGLTCVLLLRIDIRRSLELMRSANVPFLVLAVLLLVVQFAVCNLRWQILLRARNRHYPWPFLFRVYLASTALNSVLPSSLGGDFLRVAWTAEPGNTAEAVSVVLVDRALGMLGLLVLSLAASFVLIAGKASGGLLLVNLLVLGAVMFAAMALFIEPAYRLVRAVLIRIRPFGIGVKVLAVLDGIRAFRRPARPIALASGLSIASLVMYSFVWYVLGLAIGCTTPPIFYLVYVPVVALAAMIPVSIGGVGIRENGFVILMTRQGMSQPQAAAVALLFLLLTYLFALAGVIILIGLKRRAAEPPAVSQPGGVEG